MTGERPSINSDRRQVAKPAGAGVGSRLEVFGPEPGNGGGTALVREIAPTPSEAFLAAVHELRSPLAWLTGEAEGLYEQTNGPLNAVQLEVVRRIADTGSRMQRIVEDCFAYAFLETGKVPFVADLSDVSALMRELVTIWSPAFARKGVTLSARAQGELDPLPCDSHKLLRVISILLENALKFTPAGGRAELSWQPCVWARGEAADPEADENQGRANAACIRVRDSGVGIAPENQQEIFEPFVSLSRGNHAAGLGLGLAVARRLVQWHGGKIWVESEPGQGSTFAVMLPLRSAGS